MKMEQSVPKRQHIKLAFGCGLVSLAAGRSPAEIVGSNPTGGMDICLL